MKLLHLDIETAPNLAHVWGIWQVNVALNQIMAPGYVLCWAAKWDGESKVFYESIHGAGKSKMLRRIHALLSDADCVVTFNGISFDIPTLNSEFLQAGMSPPAPYKHIDLLKVAQKRFRLPSYKLEFVAKHLGVGAKLKHEGHELWVRCMNNDRRAWATMEQYNRNDILLQEKVYHLFRPWIPNPPNSGLYSGDDAPRCPNCGGDHLQRRGIARTRAQQYARYQCMDCGAWSRDNKKQDVSAAARIPVSD